MNKKLILLTSVLLLAVAISGFSLYSNSPLIDLSTEEPTIISSTENTATPLDYGALSPVPERRIVRYSNPRYRNGSMINWAGK